MVHQKAIKFLYIAIKYEPLAEILKIFCTKLDFLNGTSYVLFNKVKNLTASLS